MLANYTAVIGCFSLLLLTCTALLLGCRRRLRSGPLLLIALIASSLSSSALERRHGELVNVAANETVDDTLFATGKTVRVDGVVNGDLLASGRNVEVRGNVKGDLVSWADRVEVTGTVEGRIYNFSHSLDLDGHIGHSLYGVMQSLRVTDRGQVGEGILVAAGDIILAGDVKRSVTVATGNAEVSGFVGRDLTIDGRYLTLTNTARVGGNFNAHVRQLKDVHIADGATIAGKPDIHVQAARSHFTRPRFYFHQAIWFVAAMLAGWLGLVLFPNFFPATARTVGSGWRSLGVGVGVLAGTPLLIIVGAITLVFFPISLMLLAVYLAAIYLAKIWVGAFLGRSLLKSSGTTKHDWLLGLFVGLLILTIIGFIPYLGWLVQLAVLCLGLGAFALQLYRASRPVTTS